MSVTYVYEPWVWSSSGTTVREGDQELSEISNHYDHRMPRHHGSLSSVWEPDDGVISSSNVSALMETQGFSSFDRLHEWSVSQPEAFWRVVIDELGIRFAVAPKRVLGSSDLTNPDWLPGARMNIVASCLDRDPTSVAIISRGQDALDTMTIGDLSSLVAGFAAGFRIEGFSTGDAVAIMMPMSTEAVVAYLGIIAAGGVVVSIADSFAPEEIATRLEISNAIAVVTQSDAVRMGKEMRLYDRCLAAGAPMCIVVGGGIMRSGDRAWDDFVVEGEALDVVPMPASAHTNILFSSGTTGEPKAIPWTQTTSIKAAMDGRYHQDIHEGDVVAWPTNLGWMMGPWLIYASLLNGAAMALYNDAPTTEGFIRFVDEAGVTMLGVVPSIVSSWRASGVLNGGDWTSIRVLSSTGEVSNEEDYRWLMEIAGDVPVIEYCGGTELGGSYVTSTVLHRAIPGHFATPALGVDLVLVGDDGLPGALGEVFLTTPSIGFSTELINGDHDSVYFAGVPKIGTALRRHGDQMERVGNGYFRALGRVDDTMNLGGIKISSAELERAIEDIPEVAEVAAVAVPLAHGGPDRLIVYAVPARDAIDVDALQAEMQQLIRSRLNPLFKIHEVVLIDELARTASHKVMRRSLRAGYRARELSAGA
jgi:acetyl-CoA synthetase